MNCKGKTQSVPPAMPYNEFGFNDYEAISIVFTQFFKAVDMPADINEGFEIPANLTNYSTLFFTHFMEDGIPNCLKNLKPQRIMRPS